MCCILYKNNISDTLHLCFYWTNLPCSPYLTSHHPDGRSSQSKVNKKCPSSLQVLIGDEPEQGMENLMEVEIPEDVEEKLKEADAKEQEELAKEQEKMRQEEEEEKKKSGAEQTDSEQERGLIQ